MNPHFFQPYQTSRKSQNYPLKSHDIVTFSHGMWSEVDKNMP